MACSEVHSSWRVMAPSRLPSSVEKSERTGALCLLSSILSFLGSSSIRPRLSSSTSE